MPWLLLIVGAFVLRAGIQGQAESSEELILGAIITAVAFGPLLVWMRGPKDRLPVLEVYCFAVGIYYGLPMTNGENAAFKNWHHDFETRLRTGIYILAGLLVTQLVYAITKKPGTVFQPKSLLVLPEKISIPWLLGTLCAAVFLLAVNTLRILPSLGSAHHLLYAFLAGVGTVSSFILCRMAGEGKLQRPTAWFVFGLIALASMLNVMGLFLAPAVRWVFPAIFGYAVGSRSFPWRVVGAMVLIIAFLSLGKVEMRNQYWNLPTPMDSGSMTDVADKMITWVELSWKNLSLDQDKPMASLLTRLNLSNLMGVVVHETPDNRPYLLGKTYFLLFPLLVPRFVWPDKPIGHAATIDLTLYYGIQSDREKIRTSIGVGFLAEAYANFGLTGVLALSALIGWGLRLIDRFGRGAPALSFRGLMLVVFLAFSVYLESALVEVIVPLLHMTFVIAVVFGFLMVRQRRLHRRRLTGPSTSAIGGYQGRDSGGDVRF